MVKYNSYVLLTDLGESKTRATKSCKSSRLYTHYIHVQAAFFTLPRQSRCIVKISNSKWLYKKTEQFWNIDPLYICTCNNYMYRLKHLWVMMAPTLLHIRQVWTLERLERLSLLWTEVSNDFFSVTCRYEISIKSGTMYKTKQHLSLFPLTNRFVPCIYPSPSHVLLERKLFLYPVRYYHHLVRIKHHYSMKQTFCYKITKVNLWEVLLWHWQPRWF